MTAERLHRQRFDEAVIPRRGLGSIVKRGIGQEQPDDRPRVRVQHVREARSPGREVAALLEDLRDGSGLGLTASRPYVMVW